MLYTPTSSLVSMNADFTLPIFESSELSFQLSKESEYLFRLKKCTNNTDDFFGSDGTYYNGFLDFSILKNNEFAKIEIEDEGIKQLTRTTFKKISEAEKKYNGLIEYMSHKRHFYDFTYCPPALERTRIPAYLENESIETESEIYELSNGEKRILKSSLRNVYFLKTAYIPIELHRRISIALMHDIVFFDGVRIFKKGAYEINKDSIMYDGEMPLMLATCEVEGIAQHSGDACEADCESAQEFKIRPNLLYF